MCATAITRVLLRRVAVQQTRVFQPQTFPVQAGGRAETG